MSEIRERHPYRVHAARLLDQAITAAGVKAEWLAHVLHIEAPTLSMYRREGERPLPAFMVPLVDEALGGHALLRGLAAMEGYDLVPLETAQPHVRRSGDLEALIARHSGALLGALIEARTDGVITPNERAAIHPQVVKLIHELQAVADECDPRSTPLRRGA